MPRLPISPSPACLALGQSFVSGLPKFRFDFSGAPRLDFEKVLMKYCFVTAFGFENESTKMCTLAPNFSRCPRSLRESPIASPQCDPGCPPPPRAPRHVPPPTCKTQNVHQQAATRAYQRPGSTRALVELTLGRNDCQEPPRHHRCPGTCRTY